MKVYKYTPHVIEFIKNSMLKITPIQQLNDPFENRYTDKALRNLAAIYMKDLGMPEKAVTKLIETFRENRLLRGVIT